MTELIGKYIHDVLINPDKTIILFVTDKGKIAYRADGDCCSESWFNHISNFNSIKNWEIITNIIEREEKDETGTRQEEDKVYGYDLITSKGTCYIEMRNSSNGYYGGSLELTVDVNSAEMMVLIEDF